MNLHLGESLSMLWLFWDWGGVCAFSGCFTLYYHLFIEGFAQVLCLLPCGARLCCKACLLRGTTVQYEVSSSCGVSLCILGQFWGLEAMFSVWGI